MNKKKNIFLFSTLTIITAIFGYFLVKSYLKKDDCLDKGGSYNAKKGVCEYSILDTAKVNSSTEDELMGYNELADQDKRGHYTISEFNTDVDDYDNIDRPKFSQIIDSKIDTSKLFNIWTLDPDGPHADFVISKNEFYIVDYDGDGDMPFILKRDSLTVFYNDFILKGRIINVTNDSLKIWWEETNSATNYVEWKN